MAFSGAGALGDLKERAIGELAIVDDAAAFALAAQSGVAAQLSSVLANCVLQDAAEIAKKIDIGLSASELTALWAILQERSSRATSGTIPSSLVASLREIGFPLELLPAQKAELLTLGPAGPALDGGDGPQRPP